MREFTKYYDLQLWCDRCEYSTGYTEDTRAECLAAAASDYWHVVKRKDVCPSCSANDPAISGDDEFTH
jgi:Zn finger protein HypA/HybF involved in hydrogenase expression